MKLLKFTFSRSLLVCLSIIFVVSASLNAQEMSDSIKSNFDKGSIAMNNFQYDKAVKYLYECQRQDPYNIDYLNKLAFCYYKIGNYKEAKIYYKEILKQDENHQQALSYLGNIMELEMNYSESKIYYHRLLNTDTTNSYFYKLNGYCALKNAELEEAMKYFSQAYHLNERDIESIDQIVTILLNIKQAELSLPYIDAALKIDSFSLRTRYTQAKANFQLKHYEKVVEALKVPMSVGDTSVYYQRFLAKALIETHQYDDALFHLLALERKKASTELTYYYTSQVYLEKKDYENAKIYLNKALTEGISEMTSTYYATLASIEADLNNRKQSLLFYKTAFQYDTTNHQLLFHIGYNYDWVEKDKKNAEKYYKDYLTSGDTIYAKETMSRLKDFRELKSKYKN
ncbi:MAG: tetratricopeptide repeat protein [Saprospiraceae bacterium]|nr:tetratricopeptide repeat protein [Saprospiraceae bacterium]